MPKLRSLVALIVSVGLAGVLSGCAAQTPRSPTTLLIKDVDWPARITTGLGQLAANTPMLLDDHRADLSRPRAPDHDKEPETALVRVVRRAVHGLGIVLELEHVKPERAARPAGETELAFVSFSPLTPDGQRLAQEHVRLPAKISWDEVCAGVQWRLYEAKRSPPRGLIVHLGGNKYVRRALRARGWAVLSSPGTGRYSRRRESPQTFQIKRDTGIEEAATRLATTIDDELADWPYSLEAVLEYLADRRPDIPQEPLVVMGFSIGALGLPAVVARMPERFAAAVLVAGGANLLAISQRSTKEDAGIELRWIGAEPTREDWQQLYAAYLEQAKLDPYHTAAALADMPVLVFHAHFDQVVPAATGRLLYARLGKAQRFAYPVGHRQLLRLVMRLEAGRITRWIEAPVSSQPATGNKARTPDEVRGK